MSPFNLLADADVAPIRAVDESVLDVDPAPSEKVPFTPAIPFRLADCELAPKLNTPEATHIDDGDPALNDSVNDPESSLLPPVNNPETPDDREEIVTRLPEKDPLAK